MVKKKSMDQIEKNRKETRIECRLTYKQKKLRIKTYFARDGKIERVLLYKT